MPRVKQRPAPDTAQPASGGNGEVPHLSLGERVARGKAERAEVPRGAHGAWSAPSGRSDPVELGEEQAASRVPELVPVRYGRMRVSPFTFYRGAAYLMAADLAGAQRTGLRVQLCGDAHRSTSVVSFENARRLSFAPWFGDVLVYHLAALGARRALDVGDQRLGIDARVPQVHGIHRREASDRLAIRARHRQVHRVALIGGKAEVASGDCEARHQPLEIPFEPGSRCSPAEATVRGSNSSLLVGPGGDVPVAAVKGTAVRAVADRPPGGPTPLEDPSQRRPRRGLSSVKAR